MSANAAVRHDDGPGAASHLPRLVLVLLLAAWTLATTLPSADAIWHGTATFGFQADYDGQIRFVDPTGPAAASGIKAGDRIDMPATAMRYRVYAASRAPIPRPGEQATLTIVAREGASRAVTLTAAPHPVSVADRWGIALRILEVLVYVVVGGALVLLRPSKATWGFYLACLGINQVPPEALGLFPFSWMIIIQLGAHLMLAIGTTGFLIFALRFPSHEVFGWRALLERYSWVVFAISALLLISVDVRPVFFGLPAETLKNYALAWEIVIGLAVLAALLDTFSRGTPEDRQRIRWVIVGFSIGVGAAILNAVAGYSVRFPISPFALNLIHLFTVSVPLTVAYAAVRHRVLDVRFAFSRALVYGTITSGAIVLFALIDWFFERVVASRAAAVYVEIGASIGLGFGLHRLEKSVDEFIDNVFFHARHLADQQLARIAAALPHAGSLSAVDELLATSPADTWELSSAAVFRRERDNYVKTAGVRWPDSATQTFPADDVLMLQLQAELQPIRLGEIRWSPDGLPPGDARPVLAVPIVVRRTLAGVALYGGPGSGEAFDPDALATLKSLAAGAADAYDQLEIETLRLRVRELEGRSSAARVELGSG